MRADRPVDGLSKLNSVTSNLEVDVVLGEPASRTAEAINETGAYRSKSSGIP